MSWDSWKSIHERDRIQIIYLSRRPLKNRPVTDNFTSVMLITVVAYYSSVAQTDQTMSPLHDLGIMGRKEEGRARRTIELFHHVEESDSRS